MLHCMLPQKLAGVCSMGDGLKHEANHRMGGNKEGMEMGIVSHIASHATPHQASHAAPQVYMSKICYSIFFWNLKCGPFSMRFSWLVGIQEKCPRLKSQ